MRLTMRKVRMAGLALLVALVCSLSVGMAIDMKAFEKKSDKEKAKFLETWTETQKSELANMVKYFDENWKTEKSAVRANFCKMVGQFRFKGAVPSLVKHLDFMYFGDFPVGSRPRVITEGRPALDALIEIGMPALEPSAEHILRELDKLPSQILSKDYPRPQKGVTAKQRHRVGFFREALKKSAVDILGKDLAVVFLKKQLKQKGHGEGARKGIEYALIKIEKR